MPCVDSLFVSLGCFVVSPPMSSELQTIVALGLGALAAAYLLRTWFGTKKSSGCGGACGAVRPELKKLRSRLPGGGPH
jgi:hypothetical protein